MPKLAAQSSFLSVSQGGGNAPYKFWVLIVLPKGSTEAQNRKKILKLCTKHQKSVPLADPYLWRGGRYPHALTAVRQRMCMLKSWSEATFSYGTLKGSAATGKMCIFAKMDVISRKRGYPLHIDVYQHKRKWTGSWWFRLFRESLSNIWIWSSFLMLRW